MVGTGARVAWVSLKSALETGHDLARKLLSKMLFGVDPSGKNQLLQALTFQLGDFLNQLLGVGD